MGTFAFQPDADGTLSVHSAVYQALGAASVCWDRVDTAGVYDSARAAEIGKALLAFLHTSDTVQVYPDKGGEYRWRRLAAGNHEPLSASGEAFSSEHAALTAAARANPGLELEVHDDDD